MLLSSLPHRGYVCHAFSYAVILSGCGSDDVAGDADESSTTGKHEPATGTVGGPTTTTSAETSTTGELSSGGPSGTSDDPGTETGSSGNSSLGGESSSGLDGDDDSSSGAQPPERVNLIVNGSFEEGREPWLDFGYTYFSISEEQARSGTYSGFVGDRTASFESISYDLSETLEQGRDYEISIWARSDKLSSTAFNLAMEQRCSAISDASTFTTLTSQMITDEAWTQVIATYWVEPCDSSPLLRLYFDVAVEADIYVDDLVVYAD